MSLDRAAAVDLDARDSLAALRDEFELPGGLIYMAGNSLGPPPRAAGPRLAEAHRQWVTDLVGGWNRHDWMGFPDRLGGIIAGIIGADADEVVVADSTSVNLFKLVSAALRLRPERRVVLSDDGNFPTDLYVGAAAAEWIARGTLRVVAPHAVGTALDSEVGALVLSHVAYRDGFLHDAADLTAAATGAGALAVWDLSHSAGVVPIDVHAWGIELAVGCTYKFLCGGPGAPAFVYVARHLQERLRHPLEAWMGHASPFSMEARFRPAPGIRRMRSGTPPILALAALEPALEIIARAGVAALREKSVRLTQLFAALVDGELRGLGVGQVSPRDPARRGSQVCLRHQHAYPVVQALIARGVVCDFREPDVLRFGLGPLYQRFVEVYDAVAALRAVLETGEWDRSQYRSRGQVT